MVGVGDTFNITCMADGLPEPQVVWRRNSRVLAMETGQRVEITTQIMVPGFRTQVPTQTTVLSTLMIREVLASDNSTQFSCTAVNRVGEPAIMSTPYTVMVVDTRE